MLVAHVDGRSSAPEPLLDEAILKDRKALFAAGIYKLKRRRDFLSAARGHKSRHKTMLVQAAPNAVGVSRVGFTCSKKIGNAVFRNRAKRRLRAVAREVLPDQAQPGWDLVLIGAPGQTVRASYAELKADFENALERLHPKMR